ncbi:AAA family ATPase [archaeon]|mgnify:FL=1|jgi:Cdc6-like AAA superfamily ATPase|nr:AAA family ATPase [archaeon]MBT4022305.1 AAA family ATPase [archaeon]MBT4271738.1 AAA family ATPase [archaeon]MBT4461382.1 AAA family ATPase [archaeon]MBT4858637.1 AAA family ATPase [archaeon]
MDWYETFDFDENPFSIDARENFDKLVDMEEHVEEMNYRINAGSMLVVEGPEGSGKTTLLMMAADKFGGRRKVVYVDCEILDKNLNITHVLQERFGIIGRLFNKKPKNMILLMDNVNYLSKKNTERIKYYFDQNYIKSIIFTANSYSRAKFSDSLRDRIGQRIVKLPKYNKDLAVEVIMSRTDNNEMFNDQIITKIFKSSKNLKELLHNCEKVAMSAAKKERRRVQMADLKVLSDKK